MLSFGSLFRQPFIPGEMPEMTTLIDLAKASVQELNVELQSQTSEKNDKTYTIHNIPVATNLVSKTRSPSDRF